MYKRGTILFCQCLAAIAFLLAAAQAIGAASNSVTVDGAQTYQVIEGFGVNANSYAWNNAELLWHLADAPLAASTFLDGLDGLTAVASKTILVPVP